MEARQRCSAFVNVWGPQLFEETEGAESHARQVGAVLLTQGAGRPACCSPQLHSSKCCSAGWPKLQVDDTDTHLRCPGATGSRRPGDV